MTTDSTERTPAAQVTEPTGSAVPKSSAARVEAQRAFNLSIVVSGIRCTLAYVVFPFIAPLIGLAPGVGPVLGIGIAIVAIAANVMSIRRFWKAQHPWRRPITVLNLVIIAFMLVLIGNDLQTLVT